MRLAGRGFVQQGFCNASPPPFAHAELGQSSQANLRKFAVRLRPNQAHSELGDLARGVHGRLASHPPLTIGGGRWSLKFAPHRYQPLQCASTGYSLLRRSSAVRSPPMRLSSIPRKRAVTLVRMPPCAGWSPRRRMRHRPRWHRPSSTLANHTPIKSSQRSSLETTDQNSERPKPRCRKRTSASPERYFSTRGIQK